MEYKAKLNKNKQNKLVLQCVSSFEGTSYKK